MVCWDEPPSHDRDRRRDPHHGDLLHHLLCDRLGYLVTLSDLNM